MSGLLPGKEIISLTFVVLVCNLRQIFTADEVQLSNSGPAIAGSEILFKAVVLDGASHPVYDTTHFEYNWFNTVDGYKATTHGDKNTTLKACYEQFVPPKTYKMTVYVFYRDVDKKDNKVAFIGKSHSHFDITDTLNGNLNVTQKLKHRMSPEIYSTREPIRLHLKLTDKFKKVPSVVYSWYLDEEHVVTTTYHEAILNPITEKGDHRVRVEAAVASPIPDCEGFNFTAELTGHFVQSIELKDPVEVNVTGASNITTAEPIVINVTLNGSDPFTVCWKVNLTAGMQCLGGWCCAHLSNVKEYNITAWNQTQGNYTYNISIANDVSIVYREHHVLVHEGPSPSSLPGASSATIVLSVIAGLLLVCFFLAVTVYIMNNKKKKQVEVADFDFHPFISVTERRQSFVENIKYVFQRMLFNRNNYEETHRNTRQHSKSYGSLETSPKETSLHQTL